MGAGDDEWVDGGRNRCHSGMGIGAVVADECVSVEDVGTVEQVGNVDGVSNVDGVTKVEPVSKVVDKLEMGDTMG